MRLLDTLDEAWRRYHCGAVQHGTAADEMVAAGLPRPAAFDLLANSERPSQVYALPRRTT